MMITKTAIVVGLIGIVGITHKAQAAIIADYDFSSGLSATTSDANVTAGSFTEGASFAASGSAGRSGSGQNLFARASLTTGGGSGSLSGAITAGDYFSFIITPNAGAVMNLTSLDLNFGYSRVGGFTGKTFTADLLTSIDGFTAADSVDFQSISTDPASSTASYTSWSINLSGAQYQNITTATEFRFYLHDDTSHSDTIHRLDDVVLNGTVIPEPSSLLLLAAGLGMLMASRRRRRAHG